MSIINSIPAEWPSLIKGPHLLNLISANPIPITTTIKMPSGNVVPILDISPKQIYQIFLQQKQIAPTANWTEIIKQVLKYRYWLGKDLHFGLSMHLSYKDWGISSQNFKLYNLYNVKLLNLV